jgi:hypothetical protein
MRSGTLTPCSPMRAEPAHELLTHGGIAALKQHEQRVWIRREDLREQRVVVGMDLPQRLRTEQQLRSWRRSARGSRRRNRQRL